jgi:hypothetical protein
MLPAVRGGPGVDLGGTILTLPEMAGAACDFWMRERGYGLNALPPDRRLHAPSRHNRIRFGPTLSFTSPAEPYDYVFFLIG